MKILLRMDYSNETIEDLLGHFRPVIGVDYDKYRNHVYRVFLTCIAQDDLPENIEKYAIAAVFHDIGIWTDHTIDYLDPSIAQLRKYLANSGKGAWSEEISEMIYWHHKTSSYKARYQKTVEVFRQADWADVTFGVISFGLNKKALARNRKMLPNLGFHVFLIKKLSRNFLKNPFNPLPMFTS